MKLFATAQAVKEKKDWQEREGVRGVDFRMQPEYPILTCFLIAQWFFETHRLLRAFSSYNFVAWIIFFQSVYLDDDSIDSCVIYTFSGERPRGSNGGKCCRPFADGGGYTTYNLREKFNHGFSPLVYRSGGCALCKNMCMYRQISIRCVATAVCQIPSKHAATVVVLEPYGGVLELITEVYSMACKLRF